MDSTVQYDRLGIPVLEDREITDTAHDFLSEVDDTSLKTPCIAPIAGIIDYLETCYNLKIAFDTLGNFDGYTILSRTIFPANKIYIDIDIVYRNESLFLFTVAHAVGHWILHGKKKIRLQQSNRTLKFVDDSELDFWMDKRLGTPKDLIEHQANVFATSILMPKKTFLTAVIVKQMRMGIARKAGKIYLNQTNSSVRDFNEIVSYLHSIFGTSKQSIILRLKSLNILSFSGSKEDESFLYTYMN